MPARITAENARRNLVEAMSCVEVAISHAVIIDLELVGETDETSFTWATIEEGCINISGPDLPEYIVPEAKEKVIIDNGEIGNITIPNRRPGRNKVEICLPYTGQFEKVATIRF